ncbi:hypothetical protein CYMTET_6584 [Cymbomonas tetramitiformis]|uniref:RRM domain-containing protein n=1 Tax=Cymbomonas tetramitiformis TaxID=36881 RepID=A0AAE0GX56_9CHLO|nr:hypothetical protein CYMTET_6584 [Cymbomonas tetramitiformis]
MGDNATAGGKKKKPVKLGLTEFHKLTSWADEVEDETFNLPSAPGETRVHGGYQQDQHEIPDEPPFKVFLGNIPYETQWDDVIQDVFRNNAQCKVKDYRVIKHKDTQRPRGCFVEFEDKQSLIAALGQSGVLVGNRPLRVDTATGRRGDFDGQGDRGGFGKGGYPRDRYSEGDRYGDRGFGDRGRYGDSSFGEKGGYNNRGGYSSGYGDKGYNRGGGYEERGGYGDRGGYGGYGDRGGYGKGGYQEPYQRYEEASQGTQYGSYRERGAPRSRGFDSYGEDRRSGGGYGGQRDMGRQDGGGGTLDGQPSQQRLEGDGGDRPSQRPKLILQPKTAGGNAVPEASPGSSKPNPFGAAKPIDSYSVYKKVEEQEAKERAMLRRDEEEKGKGKGKGKGQQGERRAYHQESDAEVR